MNRMGRLVLAGAFCALVCGPALEAVPEERAAFEAEIVRLQGDNAALTKLVLTHGLALPAGMRPQVPGGPPPSARRESKVDRIMSVMDGVWRRLVAMVTGVQRDLLGRS